MFEQAALVLNASRHFRYTLDLKKEEEKEQIRRKIRSHAQVIRAALLFKAVGERVHHEVPGLSNSGYGIGSEQLNAMTKDHNFTALQSYGGVKGLSDKLNTNPEKGITRDEADILHRRHTFGANTYPQKAGAFGFSFGNHGKILLLSYLW